LSWACGPNYLNVTTTRSIIMRVFALFLSTALLLNSVQGEDVVLFRESFDDPDLAKRGWYDITAIRLAAEAQAGKSCIEYEWTARMRRYPAHQPCGARV
jgi:hypothetical protein